MLKQVMGNSSRPTSIRMPRATAAQGTLSPLATVTRRLAGSDSSLMRCATAVSMKVWEETVSTRASKRWPLTKTGITMVSLVRMPAIA
jgi:hypothetical protein